MDIETGLYNSAGFHEKVTEWLKENPGKKYRMYRYNLDGFSNINGTYGYEAGNKVLRDIAKHMRARSTDSSFAAHLNADHFVRFCSEDYPSAEECHKKFSERFCRLRNSLSADHSRRCLRPLRRGLRLVHYEL
ncbi:MAG: diguanylate cyclase [Clostridiales bacterium]|nr:MAG: diguanylate cyclase [Clostridiales bacterium]